MKRPILIGLLIALLLVAGCAKKQVAAADPATPTGGTSPDLTWSIKTSSEPPALSSNLPIDEQAKQLGKKVFAKSIATIRRSPRDGSMEYYHVAPGSPLYVSPTGDKRWLQVQMSKGRKGYVRTDQTTAAEALAQAQARLNDKERLKPGPKTDSEPDDGKAKEPTARDAAVDQAIERLGEALSGAEESFDSLRAEAAGFQGSADTWPTVKSAVSQALTEFQSEFQDVSAAVQTLTSLSGKLTANERSAFQSMVAAQGDATDVAQDLRQTLNQMTDGGDWTSLVATLDDQVRSLSSAMEVLRSGLSRL